MTKADFFMEDMICRIQREGYKDINPRPKYADGTPAHTISVNHTFRSYDLSRGDFPICTLRPQAWKTGIREIFTIYQKPTNDIATMHDMGVTWWDEWDIGDGTIGQRYGATVSRYDLINNLIKDIENDPYGRRKIVFTIGEYLPQTVRRRCKKTRTGTRKLLTPCNSLGYSNKNKQKRIPDRQVCVFGLYGGVPWIRKRVNLLWLQYNKVLRQ